MKRWKAFAAIPLVAAGVGAGGDFMSAGDKGMTDEEKLTGAKALSDRWEAAFEARDIDAMMACYKKSDKLVSYPPDELQVVGWEANRASWVEGFTEMEGATLESNEQHFKVLGDYVVSWGTFTVSMPGPDGATMTMEGRYNDVAAMVDTTWVYIMDHASVPAMMPGEGMDHDMEDDMSESSGDEAMEGA